MGLIEILEDGQMLFETGAHNHPGMDEVSIRRHNSGIGYSSRPDPVFDPVERRRHDDLGWMEK